MPSQSKQIHRRFVYGRSERSARYGAIHLQMVGNEIEQKRRDTIRWMVSRYELKKAEFERTRSA